MFTGLLIAKVAVVVLGLFIAFQAYRAARRERSQRMLLLAGGFTFLSVGSVLEGICYTLLDLSAMLSGVIQTGFVGLGMGLIAVSIFVPAGAADAADRDRTGVPQDPR